MNDVKITDQKLKEALEKTFKNHPDKIRGVDEETMLKALIGLVNYLEKDESFNANILISAGGQEISNSYGDILMEVLGEIFPSFLENDNHTCAWTKNEEDLYKWKKESDEKSPTKILIVKNVSASDTKKLFETLIEFKDENWTPAVILCTTDTTVERLKEYDEPHCRLYHYFCGINITVPDVGRENMTDIVCKYFCHNDYKVKPDFEEKLSNYIEAVYDGAALKNEEFLIDVIDRIMQVHYRKSVEVKRELDESDVPPSKKAEEKMRNQIEAAYVENDIETVKKESFDDQSESDAETESSENMNVITEEDESSDLKKKTQAVVEDENEKLQDSTGESAEVLEVSDEEEEKQASEEDESTQDVISSVIEPVACEDEVVEGKIHQVLLMAMSTIPDSHELAENEYKRPETDKEKDIKDCSSYELISGCRGQLEPVAKLMLENICEFSKVDFVMMSTKETNDKVEIREIEKVGDKKNILSTKNMSANEYFIDRIILFLNKELYGGGSYQFCEKKDGDANRDNIIYEDKKNNKVINFNIVTVDEKRPLKGIENTVNMIRNIYKEKKDIHLWLDTHGGFRDVSLMLAALLSLLKNEGIVHEKIYGVHFPRGMDIFEQNDMFEMFDFVTGMNDFFNYGSAYVLKTIREYAKSDDKKELIDAIDLIAKGTQFSAPYDYIDGVKNLIKYRNKLNPQKADDYKPNKLDIFEDNIFNDFGNDILELNPESEEFDTDIIIAIIERCREKKLYQQALTFIETMMPTYYNKKRYLYYDEKYNEEIDKRKNNNLCKDNKNFIFERNLPKYYLAEINNQGGKKAKKNNEKDVTVKKIIECFVNNANENALYLEKYKIENKELASSNIVRYSNPYVRVDNKNEDEELENIKVYIKSKIKAKHEKKILDSIFLLHKALKECRNMFNHGSSNKEERPNTESIDKAIKIYIKTVKYLNECK